MAEYKKDCTTTQYRIIRIEEKMDREALLAYLCDQLADDGFVNSAYKQATLKREATYPTGLATKPIGIAIPHSEAENVIEPTILLAVLDHETSFYDMGDNDRQIDVKLVFLLALKGENNHLNYLRSIVNFCRDEEKLLKMAESKDDSEVLKLLEDEIIIKASTKEE
ncbi:MAG: galactitol system component [Clostridiales bacterium]|jgi:PTS system galactitol-specific IIA component|nr:galactitol system component [Clostridiales bacterium]